MFVPGFRRHIDAVDVDCHFNCRFFRGLFVKCEAAGKVLKGLSKCEKPRWSAVKKICVWAGSKVNLSLAARRSGGAQQGGGEGE